MRACSKHRHKIIDNCDFVVRSTAVTHVAGLVRKYGDQAFVMRSSRLDKRGAMFVLKKPPQVYKIGLDLTLESYPTDSVAFTFDEYVG